MKEGAKVELQCLKNSAVGFYQGDDIRNNVVTYLEKNAVQRSGDKAFRWPQSAGSAAIKSSDVMPHDSITFDDFWQLVRLTAGGLKNLGLKRGDCVIVFLPMSVALYQAISAVMMIGARAVFLDSWARRDQLGASARVVDPRGMISFEQAFELCRDVPELVSIPIKVVAGPHTGAYPARLEEMPNTGIATDIQPVMSDETALVTFTTGSSGTPKGADRTHRFLSSQHMALNQVIPYGTGDLDLPAFPIFSLNNLAGGIDTVIPAIDIGRPAPSDPEVIVRQINSTGATTATLSPSMVTGVARYCGDENLTMPSLRRVITGGAPLGNHVLKSFRECIPGAELLVLYGSTEVEPIAHLEAARILQADDIGRMPGVLVGPVVDSLDYHLIRVTREPVELTRAGWGPLLSGEGEPGELVVSGLHVCPSYYNNPGAVRKTKIIEPGGRVWHRTGDVARVDKHGNLWLAGRVHNAIKRKGQVLFPVEAEELMKSLPGVNNGAYVGITGDDGTEIAVAVVTAMDDYKGDNNSLIDVVRQSLKDKGIPVDQVRLMESIPLDPRHHSKVEYRELRRELEGIEKTGGALS